MEQTVIIENCKPSLANPVDYFKMLTEEEGMSINDALLTIMEDAILDKKIEEQYPDYMGVTYSPIEDTWGDWKVELEPEAEESRYM